MRICLSNCTSHNSRDEILNEFEAAAAQTRLTETCCCYQGCGSDLITLACESVHTHVLSDCSEDCANGIAELINELESVELISHVGCERRGGTTTWNFADGDVHKKVIFTTCPIDKIDFKQLAQAPLGMVFEYNCGDSARKSSFWDAIFHELIEGGQVIGSYAADFASANRVAFVLRNDHDSPVLWGYDDYGDVSTRSELHAAIIEAARQGNSLPQNTLDRTVWDYNDRLYLLSGTSKHGISVTGVWRRSVRDFGLTLSDFGKRICRMTKL